MAKLTVLFELLTIFIVLVIVSYGSITISITSKTSSSLVKVVDNDIGLFISAEVVNIA